MVYSLFVISTQRASHFLLDKAVATQILILLLLNYNALLVKTVFICHHQIIIIHGAMDSPLTFGIFDIQTSRESLQHKDISLSTVSL